MKYIIITAAFIGIALLILLAKAISNSELIITSQENNNFEVTLSTNFEGKVYVAIYNMLGQQLGFKFAQNEGGIYKMNLNLSSAATGVYLVRVGGQNTTTYKTGRVIVK